MNANSLIRSFLIILSISIFSCGEPCDDVNCGDNGSCLEGLCICNEGYEGLNCETELRAKFLGLWKSTDYSCGLSGGVMVDWNIERGTGINDLLITLIAGTSEVPLNATYEGNTITIPLQDFSTTYQGTLVLVGEQLVLSLEINNGIAILDCTATGRK